MSCVSQMIVRCSLLLSIEESRMKWIYRGFMWKIYIYIQWDFSANNDLRWNLRFEDMVAPNHHLDPSIPTCCFHHMDAPGFGSEHCTPGRWTNNFWWTKIQVVTRWFVHMIFMDYYQSNKKLIYHDLPKILIDQQQQTVRYLKKVGCGFFQEKASKAWLLEIDEAIDFGAARNFPSTWPMDGSRWKDGHLQRTKVSSWNMMMAHLQSQLWIWHYHFKTFEMRSFQVVVSCPGIVWKWRPAGEHNKYSRTRCPYLYMSLSKYIQQNHQKNICKKREK